MIDSVVANLPIEEERALDYICDWIIKRTGLHFPDRKRFNLFQRLQRVSYCTGVTSLREMADLLKEKQSPELENHIVQTACTNHTYFFREIEILQFFVDHILPGFPENRTWRIWSAATSSGDEAYTIAILLAEYFGLVNAQNHAAILGSDISAKMLQRAEQGSFHENNLELVNVDIRKRYFTHSPEGHWQVIQAIRKMCTFRRLNLNNPIWPFRNRFHAIFCRNIFYYFDRQQQEEIMNRLYEVTLPGGWLLTSVTETLYGVVSPWKKVSNGVWRKGT